MATKNLAKKPTRRRDRKNKIIRNSSKRTSKQNSSNTKKHNIKSWKYNSKNKCKYKHNKCKYNNRNNKNLQSNSILFMCKMLWKSNRKNSIRYTCNGRSNSSSIRTICIWNKTNNKWSRIYCRR